MKLAVRSLLVLTLLVVALVIGVRTTAEERSRSAATTLDRAAARFDSCYAKSGSYMACTTGSSKVMVGSRTRTSFALSMDANFAVHLTVTGERGGPAERSCVSRGSECPQGWLRS
ncbi:MAG: hypothetical protein JWM25_1766 [Thermoleophilia bacterium]|nr:hypothetical protein [Thermoleophilia bacterium]MCZ4497181.1 hypothetical protein [Thermoleophilia bacterium]